MDYRTNVACSLFGTTGTTKNSFIFLNDWKQRRRLYSRDHLQPQSLKCLLSGPLQKMFASPWIRYINIVSEARLETSYATQLSVFFSQLRFCFSNQRNKERRRISGLGRGNYRGGRKIYAGLIKTLYSAFNVRDIWEKRQIEANC